jgi:hypothetical protein
MSKKLNIIEAMKMPIGTLFNIKIEKTENTPGFLITNIVLEGNINEKRRAFLNLATDEYLNLFSDYLDATFIPVQQPVSFMEAITSGKRIKVDVTELNEKYRNGIYIILNSYWNNVYFTIDVILKMLSEEPKNRNKIILEGKWYIEESEADSNE